MLAKAVYESFSGDFDIAKSEPPLKYDLYLKGLTKEQKLEDQKKYPERHMRQGIYVGMVDNLTETLIIPDLVGSFRI
jgi:hypothetical protein